MITFESSTFNGSESSGVVTVTVILLEGIVSSKDISVPITFTKENATGTMYYLVDRIFNTTVLTCVNVLVTNQ